MKLVTNNSIEYNVGISSTASGVIEGYIDRYVFDNFDKVTVVYNYKVGIDEIKRGTFEVLGSNIQTMYDNVKSSLPAISSGFLAWNESLYYESFKIEMVNTFPGLTSVSQITATSI